MRTRRLSSLTMMAACWWSVPTTHCRSFAWFRLACARPICRCACATRRRWSASASAMPVARVSLHSWALSLSARATPRAMSRLSHWSPRPCASWHFPVRALSQVACVRLRSCSRHARIASWPPRPCAACTPTTLWASMPAWRQVRSPMPSRPPLASCRVCTAVPRYSTAWTRCWRRRALSRRLRASCVPWSRAWPPRRPRCCRSTSLS